MKGFIKLVVKRGIVDVKGRLEVFLLMKDHTALNIFQ
jgi:hypothetical protein